MLLCIALVATLPQCVANAVQHKDIESTEEDGVPLPLPNTFESVPASLVEVAADEEEDEAQEQFMVDVAWEKTVVKRRIAEWEAKSYGTSLDTTLELKKYDTPPCPDEKVCKVAAGLCAGGNAADPDDLTKGIFPVPQACATTTTKNPKPFPMIPPIPLPPIPYKPICEDDCIKCCAAVCLADRQECTPPGPNVEDPSGLGDEPQCKFCFDTCEPHCLKVDGPCATCKGPDDPQAKKDAAPPPAL